VEAAQAGPAARNAALSFANVKTTTAIVSRLHKRRRVLSGLPAKSMTAAGTSGLAGNAMRQNAKTARLNKTGERTFVLSEPMSQVEPARKFDERRYISHQHQKQSSRCKKDRP